MTIKDHKDLDVWRKSVDLAKSVYALSSSFPKEELYGLVSQMRRSAVSVPSNIAEGAARNSTKEFIHFLHVASGSLAELDTQLIIASELKYFNESESLLAEAEAIKKMLCALISRLKEKV